MANYQKKRLTPLLAQVLSAVIWPPDSSVSPRRETMTGRRREVSRHSRGVTGTVHSGKLNRLVEFESMIERNFLQMLEASNDVIWYQEQPLAIPYTWKDVSKLYYPDFCVGLKDGRYFVAEVKEAFEMSQHQNARKLQALWQYCQRNGLGMLVTDGTKTIQDLYDRKVDSAFQNALMHQLKQTGSIGINGFLQMKNQFTTAWQDLPSIVLREELIWQMRPFLLMDHQENP